MHDGTTPLMLAVRLAVEGMVEELINADADVNASDAQGNIMILSVNLIMFIVLRLSFTPLLVHFIYRPLPCTTTCHFWPFLCRRLT